MGMAIAARVIGELGAQAWLLGEADYRIALESGQSRPLDGNPVLTPWRPALSTLMRSVAKAIDEEAVAEQLMESMVRET
jgi:hypothetical protein